MNLFEKEMRTMFENTSVIQDAKYCGKTMLGKLDDELRVKLQFIATFIAGQYDAIQAMVINRTDGIVDKQIFKFSDIIGRQKRGQLDEIEPHIWEHDGKTEWYIPVSAFDKRRIANAVLDYVGLYLEEGMEMAEMQL